MVDACVLRHRMSTLAYLGAEASWDKDRNVYIVPHLGPLLTLLPGEIGCMLRSANGTYTGGAWTNPNPESEYRITQLADGRFQIPPRTMTEGCIHALATALVPEMQRILDTEVGPELGWRQRPIKAIMEGAGEVPDHFWDWFRTLPADGLKLRFGRRLPWCDKKGPMGAHTA